MLLKFRRLRREWLRIVQARFLRSAPKDVCRSEARRIGKAEPKIAARQATRTTRCHNATTSGAQTSASASIAAAYPLNTSTRTVFESACGCTLLVAKIERELARLTALDTANQFWLLLER